eukprot:jgi/Chlat1/3781/Chrsp259S03945
MAAALAARRSPSGQRLLQPPLPTAWSNRDIRTLGLLDISDGSLRVAYKGQGKNGDSDAAAVRANHPVPETSGTFYFEVKIVNKGHQGYIGIGLSAGNVSLKRLPGWEKQSYGYHGDDGKAFSSSGTGVAYGPTFGTGDVIGCIFDQIESTISYTKNGIHLGVAFTSVKGVLYPTVGMRAPGEEIEANFGAEPFVFDYDGYQKEAKRKVLQRIAAIQLPNQEALLNTLIVSYLSHHGYCKTATAVARECLADACTLPEADINGMQQRKVITDAVLDGRIDDAMSLSVSTAPQVFEANPALAFEMRCQKFIEMVRIGDDEATMSYGRTELITAADASSPDRQNMLQDVFSLLAYRDPSTSPMGYLMEPARRAQVAASLNSALLKQQGKHAAAPLEVLYRQASVVLAEAQLVCGGAASLVSLSSVLN